MKAVCIKDKINCQLRGMKGHKINIESYHSTLLWISSRLFISSHCKICYNMYVSYQIFCVFLSSYVTVIIASFNDANSLLSNYVTVFNLYLQTCIIISDACESSFGHGLLLDLFSSRDEVRFLD
jgi:hypothetical protein